MICTGHAESLSEWALPEEASAILVALGAGLLIGVERERRMKADKVAAAAGVRTFAITALFGVLAALSGSHICCSRLRRSASSC